MKIDYDKILEIYGSDVLEFARNNTDILNANLKTMNTFQIYDITELMESYFPSFLQEENSFFEKLTKLIEKLGGNYINKLDDDMSLWEEML